MKACNIFLAGTLMVGTMAINDPAMAYFRPFSKPGCLDRDTQAMITLTQSQDSVCYLFNPPYPNTVQSAYTDTIISGCVGESPTATDLTAPFRHALTMLTYLISVRVYRHELHRQRDHP